MNLAQKQFSLTRKASKRKANSYQFSNHMKTAKTQTMVTIAVLCCSVFAGRAATFSETFDSTTLNTNLFVTIHTNFFSPPLTGTNGFSFSLSEGQALFGKEAGVGNGGLSLNSFFALVGDFTVTAECGYPSSAPPCSFGLGVGPIGSLSGADIFFSGGVGNAISANIFIPNFPGFGTRYVSTTATAASFRITRVGNTLSCQYKTGSGFETLHSATDPTLGVPMTVTFLLYNENGGMATYGGWLDSLDATAEQFLYPPWPIPGASISHAVEVCWLAALDRSYQVQWCPAVDTNTWFNFGSPVLGDGSTNCVFDSTRGRDKRFYRVLEKP